MTPREHYTEAERLLRVYGTELDPHHPALAIAQVHAILALAPAGHGGGKVAAEMTADVVVMDARDRPRLPSNLPTMWSRQGGAA